MFELIKLIHIAADKVVFVNVNKQMPFCVCCSCDEALEDLVNCDFAPHVSTLYGSTLLTKFNLARVQLLLALANSVHGHPVPGLQATLYMKY